MRTQPLAKQQACTQQYVFTQKNHLINITSLIEHSQRPMVTIIKTQVLNCVAHNSENKVLSIGRRKLNLAMRFKIVLLFLLMSVAAVAQFIPNAGQWPGQVLYRTDIPSGVMFFEKNKIVYNLMNRSTLGVHSHEEDVLNAKREIAELAPLTVAAVKDSGDKVGFHAYEVIFEGASINSGLQGLEFSEEKINYFRGNDKSRWVSNVSPCAKIKYSNLYKGIDALFYSPNGIPKYDFIIHPGGNIQDVKMKYNGANSVFLDNNKLHVQLSFTQVEEYMPIAYQIINDRKIRVDSKFILNDNAVSFSVGKNYNPNYDLVIDPVLVFSTYSGSTADNFGYTATYDEDGFLYSGSTAFDVGYPYTIGAYDKFFNSTYNGVPNNCISIATNYCWGVSDIAITKYDTSGTQRIYSTYIGGLYCEVPHSLIVNTKGELVIYGTTSSSDYPVTSNAYDTTFGGGFPIDLSNGIFVNYVNGSDIIVTILSADGSSLVGSTFLGGSSSDGLNVSLRFNYADEIRGEVITDKNDNIYIASCTYGNDLPVSTTAFQNTFGGNEEGILLKFNSDLSQLTWASYLGGNLNDAAYSLDLDSANNIVVAGGTFSSNLKTTANSLKPTNQFADLDGFVGVISNDGTTVIAMTYYGVDNFVEDQNYNVKLDRNQNIYLFGQSVSADSSMIHNASYYVLHGGQFVSKLNYALDSVVWSTTFGQNNYTLSLSPSAFMVDLCSKVYLSAWGKTATLPVTSDAFQSSTDGNDFYILVLEDDASDISYASFFGGTSGEHVDGGTSRFDRKGKIYQSMCAGCGANSDMPIFPANAVSPTNNSSNCNNGVFKMDFLIPNVIADFKSATVCSSQSFQFKNTSLVQKNTSFLWDFGDGNTSTDFQPNHIYTAAGNYTVKLKLTDPTACNLADSIVKIVKVQSYKTEDFGVDTICQGESATINFIPSNTYTSYLWVPGKYLNDSTILHPISTPSQSISYALVGDNGVCKDTMLYDIIVISSSGFLSATADKDSILKGQSVNLHVLPNTWLVNWSPASTLNDFTSVNPIANPQESTTYTVTLAGTSNLTCVSSDSIYIFVYDVICDEKDIYVPNIFTPNGDGNNDLLYVRGNNILELYFAIYDRWGEKVFETTDQKIGWDGIYKGMSSDPAVFVYYLTVKCPGDREFFTKGNITVMR